MTTTQPWTLWRTYRSIPTMAGQFSRWADGNRAIAQLQKLHPNSYFKLEFTGKPIAHFQKF